MQKFALFISLLSLLLFAFIVYNGIRVDSLERKVEALESVTK